MSALRLRPSAVGGTLHPAVLDRRIRNLLAMGLAGSIAAVLAFAITLAASNISIFAVLGAIFSVVAVVMLLLSARLEVTVVIAAFYLGMLDGPVKLLFSLPHELSPAVRDILLLAICIGVVLRLVVGRQRVQLPPLSGWVLAFTGLVLMEAFNPKTVSVLKDVAGFRSQLEWVPFFFFGYLLVRSKTRFRQAFVIIAVMALANGLVSTYQTRLSPGQLASWGPGYRQRVMPGAEGDKVLKSRTYQSEGEARVRPMGLGSDAGFGAGVGILALPGALALLATWPRRRRWLALIFCFGAMAAVATGLGRLQVIGALLAVGAFAGYAALAGRKAAPAFAAMATLLLVTIPVGVLFVGVVVKSGTFKRYADIAPSEVATTAPTHKSNAWTKIPKVIAAEPFGVGLGSVGSVGSFGGKVTNLVEGHSVSSETQYNYVTNELGAPGLLLWVALSLYIVALVARAMPRIEDGDIAIYIAATFAPFVALFFMGFSGPWYTSAATGPYFWFAIGVAAYWLAGARGHAYATRKTVSGLERPPLIPLAA
jgi:MFS family permease